MSWTNKITTPKEIKSENFKKEISAGKKVSGTVACSVCSILKNETSAGIKTKANSRQTNTQKAKQWLDRLSSGGVKIHSLSLLN